MRTGEADLYCNCSKNAQDDGARPDKAGNEPTLRIKQPAKHEGFCDLKGRRCKFRRRAIRKVRLFSVVCTPTFHHFAPTLSLEDPLDPFLRPGCGFVDRGWWIAMWIPPDPKPTPETQ